MRPALAAALVLVLPGLQVAVPQRAPDPGPILAAARVALGGDTLLAAVKTLVASGHAKRVRGKNLVPIEFEINCELPDKYVRADEIPAEETGLMRLGFNGASLIQAPAPDPDERPDAKAQAALMNGARSDFLRLTLPLFAAGFPSAPLTFSYAGRAEAPDGSADAIDAKGADGFAARLFVNTSTHLPVMLTWQTPSPKGAIDNRLYYSDYRDVSGLKWPFLIRRAIGTETVEETTVDRYRTNVRIDPRKFEVSK